MEVNNPSSGDSESPSSRVEPDDLAQLREDPAAVVKRIQELYEQRAEDDSYAELCEQISQLYHILYEAEQKFPHHTLLAFIRECGLAEMYVKFVLDVGFFDENSYELAFQTLHGLALLAIISKNMGDSQTQESLLSHCATLFRTVWVNRELLLRQRMALETDISADDLSLNPVVFCMMCFNDLHVAARKVPPAYDTYLHHITVFGWLGLKNTFCTSHVLKCLTDRRIRTSDEVFDRFIQEAIVDGMGVQNFFESFENGLTDLSKHEPFLDILFAAVELWERPAIRPFLHERETFKRCVMRLGHFAHLSGLDDDDSKGAWLEWTSCFSLYMYMRQDHTEALCDTSTSMSHIALRGEDVVAYWAHGSRWIAQAAFRRRIDDYWDITKYCDEIVQDLDFYANVYSRPSLGRRAPDFIAGLIRGVRQVWMPTLVALRTGRSELGAFSAPYNRLLNGWTTLGAAMLLDESRERKEMLKFCAHWCCQFNKRQPPNALSSCRGCGEARYCSKECQRSDWKVHKRLCGKRLK